MENTLTIPALPEAVKPIAEEPQDKPQRVYSPFAKRHSRLLCMLAAAALGIVLGAAVIALPQRADLSAIAALKTDGSFLELMLLRIVQTGAILTLEYAVGYFALGSWLVWAAPLISGLGAGLSAAYMCSSGSLHLFLLLIPSVLGSAALCSFGANASSELSELLLRLVSGNKNSIVMTGSSSRAYTLRFGAYLAILLVLSIYEAAVKLSLT